jgi:hypothetical protein
MTELPPDIKIIDNFILPYYADRIEDLMMCRDWNHWGWEEGSTGPLYPRFLSWVYHEKVAISYLDPNNSNKDHPQNDHSGFVKTIYNRTQGHPIERDQEAYSNFLFPMIYSAVHAYNPKLSLRDVYRIRAILNIQQGIGRTMPHRDLAIPHTTMVYYVNDSDGPTVIFNNNMEVIVESEPKKGKAIIFGGHRYHCGTLPEKHKERIAINVNFKAVNI